MALLCEASQPQRGRGRAETRLLRAGRSRRETRAGRSARSQTAEAKRGARGSGPPRPARTAGRSSVLTRTSLYLKGAPGLRAQGRLG
ncbi:unnamed protein product [Rangifer tarandus platyrhynchus]|uniref:Uncharacterized protein n=1 Tax=Rangifer tarandus platyrhynchus TaxID=3082113 RepID=A0ABN8YP59_RANTA|nr:unnamed protein product [Rangifer tarandus platyrhynchus]